MEGGLGKLCALRFSTENWPNLGKGERFGQGYY